MDNVGIYHNKVKQLLDKFTYSKCQTGIATQLGQLLDYLQDENAAETTLALLMEWLPKAVTTWSSKKIMPSRNISSFVLNVAAWLSKKEEKFCALNNNNFFIKLINTLKARQPKIHSLIELAYINLLSSFLDHASGIEWMMACCFWEDIYQLSLANHGDDVTENSHKFMSKLLEKTINHDETFCHNVVKRIMQPLGENIYKSLKDSVDLTEVPEETVSQNLRPTLLLIGNLLERCLEEALYCKKDLRIPFAFLKISYSEKSFSDFTLIAQNRYLTFELGRIMFIMEFLEIYIDVINKRLDEAHTRAAIMRIQSTFIENISKGPFEDVIKFCVFGLPYWKVIITKLLPRSVDSNDEIVLFDSCLPLLILFPNYAILGQFDPKLETVLEEHDEEFRNAYYKEIMKVASQETIRLYYIWREHFFAAPNVPELCLKSLKCIKQIRKNFSRQQAVLGVRELTWTLKDTMFCIKRSPEILTCFDHHFNNYFSAIFENVIILIKEFQISWRDGFETIDVLDAAFEFLTLFAWPLEAVVEALNLISVCIAKYMTANLALLVDKTSDSTLTLLGPLLLTKLTNGSGAIRRAAVGVITTMARMSTTEFPSLQKILMDSNLPNMILKIIVSDEECVVRVAAIQSLQSIAQVEALWNSMLQREELPARLTNILLNDDEKSLRMEASACLHIFYKQQRFVEDDFNNIYKIMAHSSTFDQSREVRLRSLSFWDTVIKTHLQNQGMIDGRFPEVTFSKEQKKIVTLTDLEIRKRLIKVLEQLISVNCLDVIVHALTVDCDMEVSKTALAIIQPMLQQIKKYKLCNNSSLSVLHFKNFRFQFKKGATPEEFLQFAYQDLENLLVEKRKCLNIGEELALLVDDILKIYDKDTCTIDLL